MNVGDTIYRLSGKYGKTRIGLIVEVVTVKGDQLLNVGKVGNGRWLLASSIRSEPDIDATISENHAGTKQRVALDARMDRASVVLSKMNGRWLECNEIATLCNISDPSCYWSLRFLKDDGLVEYDSLKRYWRKKSCSSSPANPTA